MDRAQIDARVGAFVYDQQVASYAFAAKSARAVWDPDLDGFRCPPGVVNGGQITNRFGQGCGMGVARRLVNLVGDAGRAAQRLDDNRAQRRAAPRPRGQRAVDRLAERAARVGAAIAGDDLPEKPKKPRSTPSRAAERAVSVDVAQQRTPNTPGRRRRATVRDEVVPSPDVEPQSSIGVELQEYKNQLDNNWDDLQSIMRLLQGADGVDATNRIISARNRMADLRTELEAYEGADWDDLRSRLDSHLQTLEGLADWNRENIDFRAQAARPPADAGPVNLGELVAQDRRDFIAETQDLVDLIRNGGDYDLDEVNQAWDRLVEIRDDAEVPRVGRLNAGMVADDLREAIEAREADPFGGGSDAVPAGSVNRRAAMVQDANDLAEMIAQGDPYDEDDADAIWVRLREVANDEANVPERERIAAGEAAVELQRAVAARAVGGTSDDAPLNDEDLALFLGGADDLIVRARRGEDINDAQFEAARSNMQAIIDDPGVTEGQRDWARYNIGQIDGFLNDTEEDPVFRAAVRDAVVFEPDPLAGLNDEQRQIVGEVDALVADMSLTPRQLQLEGNRLWRTFRNEERRGNLESARFYKAQAKRLYDEQRLAEAGGRVARPAGIDQRIEDHLEGSEAVAARKVLEAKVDEMIAGVKKRRLKVLARYLDTRYGEDAPWLDPERSPVGFPAFKKMFDDARSDLLPEGVAARAKFDEWKKSVWQHDEIVGKGGQRFRTRVDMGERPGVVHGQIDAFNEATGEWEEVGKFTREISLHRNKATVYNAFMMMGRQGGYANDFAEGVKGSGFQTVFNPHAFMKLKAAGFASASVSAAGDGAYVWGRVGFRAEQASTYRNLAEKMEKQVEAFKRGRPSLVLNDAQAALLGVLIQRARESNFSPESAPGHGDYLMMLDAPDLNPGVDMQGRARTLKTWFTDNLRFGSGVFTFGEGNVLADPRYPEGRPRPQSVVPSAPRRRAAAPVGPNAALVNAQAVMDDALDGNEVNSRRLDAAEAGLQAILDDPAIEGSLNLAARRLAGRFNDLRNNTSAPEGSF